MATVLNIKATSEQSFDIGINAASAIKLYNSGTGILQIKNKAGSAFLDFQANNITGNIITAEEVRINSNILELNYDASGTGSDQKMTFARPLSGMSGAVTYTFPAAPTNGYFLTTDGSGNMAWAAVSSPSVTEKITVDTTSFSYSDFGSPLSMFTLPANAIVHRVEIIVDQAFDTGSVQILGYLLNSQSDLTDQSKFVVEPVVIANPSTVSMQLAFSDFPTFGQGRVLVHYSIPA